MARKLTHVRAGAGAEPATRSRATGMRPGAPRRRGRTPGNGRLTRAQLRELELELRSARARLERSMGDATTDGAAPSIGGGFAVPADAEGGVAVALQTRAVARHQALVDAITRIEAGTYGTCVSCHQPIPYARLAVMPEASRCMACGSRP